MMQRVMVHDNEDRFLFELSPQEVLHLTLDETINGEHSLTIDTTHVLGSGNRILTKDNRGIWREHVVYGTDQTHKSGVTINGIYHCVWSLQHDLMGTTVSKMPGVQTPVTAGLALEDALSGTSRWVPGTVTRTSSGGASMYDCSGWEALSTLVDVWGGEVGATIEVSNSGIISRKVDLYEHQGETKPLRRFDFGADVESIRRKVEDGPVYCRISPRGKGEAKDSGGYGRKITIKPVNGQIDWLQNDAMVPYARVKTATGYEYPTLIVENSDCETPSQLKQWGLSVLEEYTTPKVVYEVDVVQAASEGVDLKGVSLGDEVHVVDKNFGGDGLRLSARVMSVETDMLEDSKIKLVIGNAKEGIADIFGKIRNGFNRASARISKALAEQEYMATSQYLSELLDRLNAEINADGGYTYITEGQGIRTYDQEVSDPLIGAEATKVVEIKGGSIRIANTKTAQGEWEWKTVFTSGHIAAELVTAAQITAGYIGSADSGNYWDLDTGEFRMASTANIGDRTVQQVLADVDAIDDMELGATNLVRNGDFFSGTYLWASSSGTTITAQADSTFDHCLKAEQGYEGGYWNQYVRASSGNFQVEANVTYSISFWAKSDSANTIYAAVGNGAELVSGEEVSTTWKRFTGTGSSRYQNRLSFWLGSAGTLYIANVMLVESDKPMVTWGPDPRDALVKVDSYLTQQEVFNRLTNNGALQGLYMSNGDLYMNATYIKTGQLLADLITSGKIQSNNGKVYFDLDNNKLVCDMMISTQTSSTVNVVADIGSSTIGTTSVDGLKVYKSNNTGHAIILEPGASGTIPSITTNSGHICMEAFTHQGGSSRSGGLAGVMVTSGGYACLYGQNSTMSESDISSNSNTHLGRVVCHPHYGGSGSTYSVDGEVNIRGTLVAYYATSKFQAIQVSGQKSRVAKTENYNNRLLYCYETPSPMFGDVGSGIIGEDGTCVVMVDDIFSETARTDLSYWVFLQKCGQGDLWVSDKSMTNFTVEGTPGLAFDWELKAKQTDYETLRLEEPDLDELMKDNTEVYAYSVEDQHTEELDALINQIEALQEIDL